MPVGRARAKAKPPFGLLAAGLSASAAAQNPNDAKARCFENRWTQTLCCAEEWPPGLAQELSGCFVQGRTRDLCCVRPAKVLIFTYPKVASRYLITSFNSRGYYRARDARISATHNHIVAEYEFKRMQPPCLVVMVARNLYSRNPSHFFYNVVLEEWDLTQVKQTYAKSLRQVQGRFEIPEQMYTGRWSTQDDFYRSSDHEVRQAFYNTNVEISKGYLRDYFGLAGDILGVDLIKLAKRHPKRPYVFANASKLGCKCDVLLLSYEHIGTWSSTLRKVRALDRMPKPEDDDHRGVQKWYGPHYVGFMGSLIYTEHEAAAMCQTDTMRELPFYAGHCGRCAAGVCREIHPGAQAAPAPSYAEGLQFLRAMPLLPNRT